MNQAIGFFCKFHFLVLFYMMGSLEKMKAIILLAITLVLTIQEVRSDGDQPLSKISVHQAVSALHAKAYVKASPALLGLKVMFVASFILDNISHLKTECPIFCHTF